jgi:hypothetical protein
VLSLSSTLVWSLTSGALGLGSEKAATAQGRPIRCCQGSGSRRRDKRRQEIPVVLGRMKILVA